tara:strand:- start:194 stop:493 length:300 start_codon:yes stop_codon:yes gene_type:complete
MASKDIQKEKNNRERILDFQYYFGKDADEWINKKQITKDKVVDTWRKKGSSEYPPQFCNKCNRYWAFALNSKHKKVGTYLKNSIFKGLRCDTVMCNNCL